MICSYLYTHTCIYYMDAYACMSIKCIQMCEFEGNLHGHCRNQNNDIIIAFICLVIPQSTKILRRTTVNGESALLM